MSSSTSNNPLANYFYDPLDRLIVCTPSGKGAIKRFYQHSRLGSEIQEAIQRSFFQHDDRLLAQVQRQANGVVDTILLATNQQRSVLNTLDTPGPDSMAYTAYGHAPLENALSLLGFNGERSDPVTGHYSLGNGHRQFNPVLMRFNSPDSWSPFNQGGLNAYAYCAGDPVNRSDPTGRFFTPMARLALTAGMAATTLGLGVASLVVDDEGLSKALGIATAIVGGLTLAMGITSYVKSIEFSAFRPSDPTTKYTFSQVMDYTSSDSNFRNILARSNEFEYGWSFPTGRSLLGKLTGRPKASPAPASLNSTIDPNWSFAQGRSFAEPFDSNRQPPVTAPRAYPVSTQIPSASSSRRSSSIRQQ